MHDKVNREMICHESTNISGEHSLSSLDSVTFVGAEINVSYFLNVNLTSLSHFS